MFAKKNLVAAAALLALAGAAQAQVKLYGMVDMSVGSFENAHAKGASVRTTEVASGKMMTSYFGLSGSEDLGGGLKAEFVLESFLGADNGQNVTNLANGFWSRGSFLALSGGFGKLAVGQYDNPLFTAGYLYNPFGSSMQFSPTMRHYYASNASLPSGGNFALTGAAGFDTGFVNSLTYETPNMGGFMATLQYSPKESAAANTKNSYSAAVNYTAGPLSAQLTYVKGGLAAAYSDDQKVWSLGGSYDFGMVKAFLQYTDSDSTTNAREDKMYQVGVTVPLSDKASVMASYGQLKRDPDAVGVAESKDKVFSLGYGYTLSKRTDVYGVFTNNTATGLESGQTFAVGIRHNF
jgi:predicted porin